MCVCVCVCVYVCVCASGVCIRNVEQESCSTCVYVCAEHVCACGKEHTRKGRKTHRTKRHKQKEKEKETVVYHVEGESPSCAVYDAVHTLSSTCQGGGEGII